MLTLVIQAGGQSRRMGEDKGLLQFEGAPLVQRVLNRVGGIADRALVISNQPENYEFLEIDVVKDLRPGGGALGGLLTALGRTETELVAMVACDMPFANASLLAACYEKLVQDPELDAAIPVSSQQGYYEVFHAVYRRETCLPAVRRALDRGRRKLISWLDEVNVIFLTPDEVKTYDPDGLAFWNLNTPEDVARAERLAHARKKGS